MKFVLRQIPWKGVSGSLRGSCVACRRTRLATDQPTAHIRGDVAALIRSHVIGLQPL